MISQEQYIGLANYFGISVSKVKAIDFVESNGQGFDPKTGKIKIQFEPHYFKRISRLVSGLWSSNKVDIQSKEWEAFNDAFKKNPKAAMESTSIGRMQVMGEHWKRLDFKSVNEMWDFAKKSESNQLWLGLKFISTDSKLFDAVKKWNCKEVALRYNGKNYWIKGYDKKLEREEIKFRALNT
jgi:hypothetical protein